MDLISLIVWIVIFACVAYGIYWVCTHFALPRPVLWICGVILLIILLVFLMNQTGISLHAPVLRHPGS